MTDLVSSANIPNSGPAELQGEIQKEGGRYIRHVSKLPPNQALSPKDVAIQTQVETFYAEIDKLSREKEQLAERIVQLIARSRARLDCDLSRVLTLQGEPDHSIPANYYYGASRNPVTQLNESLRSAIAVVETPSTPVSVPQGAPPLKSAFCSSLPIETVPLTAFATVFRPCTRIPSPTRASSKFRIGFATCFALPQNAVWPRRRRRRGQSSSPARPPSQFLLFPLAVGWPHDLGCPNRFTRRRLHRDEDGGLRHLWVQRQMKMPKARTISKKTRWTTVETQRTRNCTASARSSLTERCVFGSLACISRPAEDSERPHLPRVYESGGGSEGRAGARFALSSSHTRFALAR